VESWKLFSVQEAIVSFSLDPETKVIEIKVCPV